MRVKVVTIPDDVLTVLRASQIDADGLRLPGQLHPNQYQKVKKVLEANGLKWNRGKGTHVFTDANAQSRISAVVENGNFIDEKKSYDFFETPEHVAADMAELLDLKPTAARLKYVLEPSAGKGRLLRAVRNKYGMDLIRLDSYELNPECAKACREAGFNCTGNDFMLVKPSGVYEGIIMNPPFSVGQDVRHVIHAEKFLAPHGRLVAIVSPAYTFREGPIWSAFRNVLNASKVIVEKELPSGTFKESGTNVRTMLLCLEKK